MIFFNLAERKHHLHCCRLHLCQRLTYTCLSSEVACFFPILCAIENCKWTDSKKGVLLLFIQFGLGQNIAGPTFWNTLHSAKWAVLFHLFPVASAFLPFLPGFHSSLLSSVITWPWRRIWPLGIKKHVFKNPQRSSKVPQFFCLWKCFSLCPKCMPIPCTWHFPFIICTKILHLPVSYIHPFKYICRG